MLFFFQTFKTVFLGFQKNQGENIQKGMHIHYGCYNFRKKIRYVVCYRKGQILAKNKSILQILTKIKSILLLHTTTNLPFFSVAQNIKSFSPKLGVNIQPICRHRQTSFMII
jgi:hypothetical protein